MKPQRTLVTASAEAETSAIPVKQERRGSIRYPCGQEVTFRLFGMPDDHCWNAELLDVSASGAGLVTGCAFGRGTVLEVRPADRSLTVSRLLMRVNNVTMRADDAWLLGCTFVREVSDAEARPSSE